jgi:hypothetical protein
MSRQADEKRYSNRGSSRTPAKASAGTTYVFRPTKEQKEEIKLQWTDLEKNLMVLADYVENGNKLNLGYAPSTGALYISLRESSEEWTKARAVSVWHGDIIRAIAMLAYYLREVNENFPEGLGSAINAEELSW